VLLVWGWVLPPARGGCKIWRSGWKNARGAGRTKEWDLEEDEEAGAGQICKAIALASLLPHVTTNHPCALSGSTRFSAGGFALVSVKAEGLESKTNSWWDEFARAVREDGVAKSTGHGSPLVSQGERRGE
jgi:hypothetical protein